MGGSPFWVAPFAKSAASALMEIGDVAQSCDQAAEGAVKAAERAARDVVVVRCRCQEEAFGRRGRGLDRELEACLRLAFYKLRLRV